MKTTIDMQNSIKGTKIALGGILFLSLLSGAGYSQNNNVCTINADNKGNFTSMIVSNPLTSLGIEKSFFFEVDNIGIPVKGTVSSLNGADRELKTPEELILMWAQFGGPRAFWDYNAKQGKIVSYTSINDISNSVYGKPSRVFIRDGKDFIGKLTRGPNQENVLLEVGTNNPLQIDKAVIREVQQLKF